MTRSWSRTDRARALLPLAALVVGVASSVASAAYLRRVQNTEMRERFDNRSRETAHALTHGLDGSGDSLRGLRGLFDGSAEVTRDEFGRFLDALDTGHRFPGVAAVAYVRADAQRTVAYVEPSDMAPAVEGGPLARQAQDRAADSGRATATPPLRRPGEDGVAFLVFLPLYDSAGVPATEPARRAALRGWVVNSYRGAEFVAGQLTGGYAVESALFQGPTARPEAFVGSSPGYGAALREGPGWTRDTRITAYGVPWTIRTAAPRTFLPGAYRVAPWLLLVGSLLMTALTALVLRTLLTARRRAERAVADTTRTLRENEERFRALADCSPTGVFFANDAGDLEYSNPRLAAIAGVESFDGGAPRDLIHDDDKPRLDAAWRRAVEDRSVLRGTYRVVRPDGSLRWVDIATGPTRDESGAVTGWVGSADDVTDKVESLRRTDRLTRVLEHTTDLVTITDPGGEVVWANDAARRFMRAVGVVPHRLDDLVAPTTRNYFADVVLPALRREGRWSGELSLLGPDDTEIPVSQLIQAHHGSDGQLQNYSFTARDLSERVDYQTRLAHEVLHDRLTGLPNRVLFVDRLTQSLARTARRESLVAVLFVDIDRFKLVNDSLGHDAGDRLLLEVSGRLQGVLRQGDTAARFGGDEFTLLCEEVVDDAQATAIAQRVLSVLSVPFVLDGSPVHVTASVGIAVSDGSDPRPEDMLRDADAALHRAKELGKARYELFDERLRASAVARFQTESALHEAIDTGQLRVYYQPEVCLRTGRVVGAEALVRWLHPENGLVQPDAFVPLAEESGLIGRIGGWVLREACWQAARWRGSRDDGEPFVVWVNLSPRQLAEDIVGVVEAALVETGVDPRHIGLEVTESALLGDAEAAIGTLQALRALGVRIVIDDFGTGYSSLAYLRRLPVDGVKIDRSFVAGLGTSPEDSAIVRAVVGMASALGLDTIAEGVESRAQLDELTELGCAFAQGFYFARPEPRQSIDALIAQRPEWPGLARTPSEVTPLQRHRRLRGH
ncbi:MAG TPA: EAL domain-containing protein [Frankiaceae bacterium]|nr:EAL domain-containing protein [Frankiaceae bacterium]